MKIIVLTFLVFLLTLNFLASFSRNGPRLIPPEFSQNVRKVAGTSVAPRPRAKKYSNSEGSSSSHRTKEGAQRAPHNYENLQNCSISKPRLEEAAAAKQSHRKRSKVASQKNTKPGLLHLGKSTAYSCHFSWDCHTSTKIHPWHSPHRTWVAF